MTNQTDDNCVFCDRLVIDHSNFECRACLVKHIEIQKILQQAIGDGASILETSQEVNDMGASCKGICLMIEQEKIPNALKYKSGMKRCSWCEVWLKLDETRCPCCRMKLRTKARGK